MNCEANLVGICPVRLYQSESKIESSREFRDIIIDPRGSEVISSPSGDGMLRRTQQLVQAAQYSVRVRAAATQVQTQKRVLLRSSLV